jgi:hypothetical protein
MAQGDTDDAVELGSGPEWPEDEPRVNEVDTRIETTATVPLLPAVASRLDTVHTAVSVLGMRVDALGSLTSSVGSAMADRLAEFGDTVEQVTRAQGETLDEYRHGTERTISELRRSLAASDEVIRRLSGRVDELVTDTTSLLEIVRVLGSVPLRAEVDQRPFDSEAKLDSLAAAVDEIANALGDALASAPARSEGDEWSSGSEQKLESLHAAVEEIAADFSTTMSRIAAPRDDLSAELQTAVGELRAEVKAIASSRRAPSGAAESAGAPPGELLELVSLGEELGSELVSLRSEIVQLKRRIGVRAKSSGGLDESQLREVAGQIAASVRPPALSEADLERIVESVRPPALTDADIQRIVTAIAAQLESTFEVVADDEPTQTPPPPPPPVEVVAEKPSRRRK